MSVFFNRIMAFAKAKGYKNINKFAKQGLGWSSPEKINRLKSPDSTPSVDTILEITNKFQELNPSWLITGEGDMIRPATIVATNISHGNNGTLTQIAGTTADTANIRSGDTAHHTTNNHYATDDQHHAVTSNLLEELAAQRRVFERAQEQMDVLIRIIQAKHKG